MKEVPLPVAQMFVCAEAGVISTTCLTSAGQKYKNSWMNFFFFLFPLGSAWCCYSSRSEARDSCKTKMVVKILTTSAWLRSWVFKHTHGERGGKKLGFGVVQCVCAFGTRSPQWCCVGGLLSGEVRGKWVVPEVLELGLQTREEGGKLSAQIACWNSGFLDVRNEDPYFWSCVVELFKWKRNARVYFIYFAVSFLKISLDFLHRSALLPAYKSPSIVFSLHPVFFVFFEAFLQG